MSDVIFMYSHVCRQQFLNVSSCTPPVTMWLLLCDVVDHAHQVYPHQERATALETLDILIH